MTDKVNCSVIIIAKDDSNIAAVQFKILFDFFSTSLKSSLIIFIQTYTVSYRNVLDRRRVRMNIILSSSVSTINKKTQLSLG